MNLESKFSTTSITCLLPFPGLDSKDFHSNITKRGSNTIDGKIMTEIRTSRIEPYKDLFGNLNNIIEIKNWIYTH